MNLRAVLFREWSMTIGSLRMVLQSIIEPLVYLLLFGPALSGFVGKIDVGGAEVSFLSFMVAGITVMAALSIGQYAGITIYMEKSGELEMLFGTPIPRSALVVAKVISAATRTTIKTLTIFAIAILFLGQAPYLLSGQTLAVSLLVSVIIAAIFSSIMVGAASLIESQHTFNLFVNIFILPVTFASTAFYPLEAIPSWLRPLAFINPLTYGANIMREQMFLLPPNPWQWAVLFSFLVTSFVFGTAAISKALR